MNGDQVPKLEEKVDLLIRLVGARCVEGRTATEAIELLARLGLERLDIARICDTTPQTVSVRLSEARKKSQSRRRSNE